jgi:hypothetical protein
MTFENEYYLSKKPTTVMIGEVAHYLVTNNLQVKFNTIINNWNLINDGDKYMKHVNGVIANKVANLMLENKKLDFTMVNRPFDESKIIETRTIVMTDKELLALLTHFGVDITVPKGHDNEAR